MDYSHISNNHSVRASIGLRFISAIVFFVMMGLGISSFSSDAQAQDITGWELNAGVGFGSWALIYNPGFSFMVSGGYRFTDWFSLNLEQSVYVLSEEKYDEDEEHKKNDFLVFGDTTLTTKFFWLNDAKNFEVYVKAGAGVIYVPDNYSTAVFWSLPTGIGGNYFFNEKLGLGLDVQYNWTFWTGAFKALLHLAVRI